MIVLHYDLGGLRERRSQYNLRDRGYEEAATSHCFEKVLVWQCKRA